MMNLPFPTIPLSFQNAMQPVRYTVKAPDATVAVSALSTASLTCQKLANVSAVAMLDITSAEQGEN